MKNEWICEKDTHPQRRHRRERCPDHLFLTPCTGEKEKILHGGGFFYSGFWLYVCLKFFIMSNGTTQRPLTGIILAGGESSRMGSDKGWMTFRGKPLVWHALDLLVPICDDILVSANDARYETLGFPVVKDEVTGAGPLGGLCASLKRSSSHGNLVVPCDTPFLTRELIDYLLSTVRGQQAVIPVHPDGRAEPLCGYYSKEILPLMEKNLQAGKYKLIDILREADAFFLKLDETLPFYHPRLFTNLNTPGDLARTPINER